jgi:N-acetylglucosaminyldiphosphoundecaprenol N-acetyl-beta-D-mannosaminyltransferase
MPMAVAELPPRSNENHSCETLERDAEVGLSQRSPQELIELFGIQFDALRMEQVLERLFRWIDHPTTHTRYVVTPNVDHTVLYQQRADLREAYARSSMVIADGKPVVHASRWLKRSLPECVPGSDLVPALFAKAQADQRPLKIFLLGAAVGVADRAAEQIAQRWPVVTTVGTSSPPIGFDKNPEFEAALLDQVNAAAPDVLVVGLGAPKQELWVSRHRDQIQAPVSLCVGATIDFLAGERHRAPMWLRRLSLEWLHRMLEEPRRLVPRYARDAWIFPQLIVKQFCVSYFGQPARR